MNKLIMIVGASGVGKTTLTKALAKQHPFDLALEQHTQRPFQGLFKQDPKYALPNQIDYLLFRAEQEYELRQGNQTALTDGGLDLDFHGFTRLFHARGWLTDPEFDLCHRLYSLTRSRLPPPDLIISLTASTQTIKERLASRSRINIASSEDADMLAHFIGEWLESLPPGKVLKLDTSLEGKEYSKSIHTILQMIGTL
jgi:deoxyadenosine/deoxycytidine kinase